MEETKFCAADNYQDPGLEDRIKYRDNFYQKTINESTDVSQYQMERTDAAMATVGQLKDAPRCSICGDKSIGKQYGAFTCDGCKSFFRRSVRSRSLYTCVYGGHCMITMTNRNHCRYCRMMKCLDVGMRVEAVQEGAKKTQTGSQLTINV